MVMVLGGLRAGLSGVVTRPVLPVTPRNWPNGCAASPAGRAKRRRSASRHPSGLIGIRAKPLREHDRAGRAGIGNPPFVVEPNLADSDRLGNACHPLRTRSRVTSARVGGPARALA